MEEFPGVINLNVGGTHTFTTLLSTLTKHDGSHLADLFNGETDVYMDNDGRYFLDVDGSTFGTILEYLKFGLKVFGDGFNNTASERLHASACALGLTELTQHLEKRFPSLGSAEQERAKCDRVSSDQLEASLSLSDSTQPSVSTSTTPRIPLFGISQCQPATFKLREARFDQPNPQGQVGCISTKEEGFAFSQASPNQQQHSGHFGKAPEFQNPLGKIGNPASIASSMFGGDSVVPTLSSLSSGSSAFPNALMPSDGQEPGVKNVEKRHH